MTIRLASQRPINVAVIVSAVTFALAAGLTLSRARRRAQGSLHVPVEPLRYVHTTFVVIAALGLFSIVAGPVPGIVAGVGALALEHRPSMQRTIGWLPLPMVLGVGIAKALRQVILAPDIGPGWADGTPWADFVIWLAVAVAATAALANSERRPNRRIVL